MPKIFYLFCCMWKPWCASLSCTGHFLSISAIKLFFYYFTKVLRNDKTKILSCYPNVPLSQADLGGGLKSNAKGWRKGGRRVIYLLFYLLVLQGFYDDYKTIKCVHIVTELKIVNFLISLLLQSNSRDAFSVGFWM